MQPRGVPPYELGYNRHSRGSELLDSLRGRARQGGPAGALLAFGQFVLCRATYAPLHRRRTFRAGGEEFPYLARTATTERCIEVPWVVAHLARAGVSGDRVLEVGNVLSQYTDLAHVIVDKYELDPRVSNVDVLEYRPPRRFPIVVSISTLEHVGFDEPRREPGKFLRALRYLRETCLAEDGRMLVTLPFGYNPEVDEQILSRSVELGAVCLLRRTSSLNLWQEVDPLRLSDDPSRYRYGRRYAGAEVVALSYFGPARDHR
jgi:hypothetical protein